VHPLCCYVSVSLRSLHHNLPLMNLNSTSAVCELFRVCKIKYTQTRAVMIRSVVIVTVIVMVVVNIVHFHYLPSQWF